MKHTIILAAGETPACRLAAAYLRQEGVEVCDTPRPDVTHLLLDTPSFSPDGALRCGGDVRVILKRLPGNVTIIGGNLEHSALEGYQKIDLLTDPFYLAENAAITAHCALQVALPELAVTLRGCPVVITGWGRIGKCLAQLLQAMGAVVTIAARKEADRALLRALGYRAVDYSQLPALLPECRLLFNTVPGVILNPDQLTQCHPDCVKVELASKDGMAGDGILIARGLPGKLAPESTARLMVQTILRNL